MTSLAFNPACAFTHYTLQFLSSWEAKAAAYTVRVESYSHMFIHSTTKEHPFRWMGDLFCKNVTFDVSESKEFHVDPSVKANSDRAYNQRKDHSQEDCRLWPLICTSSIFSPTQDQKCFFDFFLSQLTIKNEAENKYCSVVVTSPIALLLEDLFNLSHWPNKCTHEPPPSLIRSTNPHLHLFASCFLMYPVPALNYSSIFICACVLVIYDCTLSQMHWGFCSTF